MLETTLNLYSNFVPVLENIIDALDYLVLSAGDVQNATDTMMSEMSINFAKQALEESCQVMQDMENNINDNATIQEEFNERIIEGEEAQRKLNDLVEESSKIQETHNKKIERGYFNANKLLGSIKRLAATYLGIRGISLFTDSADDYINTRTRLSNVLDQFQEDSIYTIGSFQQAVFDSARRARADYSMVSDVISKLGMQARNAFKAPEELIIFSEQLSKNFKIAGTDAEGVRSVMYNLTQAMASGVLRGQDLNSVMANAPIIAQRAAEFLGKDISEVRKLAEEGKLTADVIKNAMLASADKTNEAFASMPKTLEDIKTQIKSTFSFSMADSFVEWNEFLQTDEFEQFTDYIVSGLGYVSDALMWIVEAVVFVGNVISDHADIIIPVLYGVAVALGIWEVATLGMTAAQWALNAALNASPIGWVLSLIGLIVAGVAVWARKSGGLANAWKKSMMTIGDFAEMTKMRFKLIGMQLDHGTKNLVRGIEGVFYLAFQRIINSFVIRYNRVIELLNKIPGIDLGKADMSTVGTEFWDDYKTGYEQREKEIDDYQKVMELKRDANARRKMMFEQRIKTEKAEETKSALGFDNKEFKFDGMDGLQDGIDGIGKDAKGIRDAVEDGVKIKDEDIEAIRDVMFNRSISGMTSSPIHVHVDNKFGDVHETADLDGWIAGLEDGIAQAIATVGVS